ncbi:MAG: DUF2971 domain-containing protein [Gemmatimonadota bacterium]|nr:DUF2971 domain-containing protein [Gemmatimonadota bacterium]
MYKVHDSFNTPPLKASLWRYIDFTKFVSLLEKQALFFSNAANFSDPFEGAYPTRNLELVSEDYRPQKQAFTKSVGNSLFVNCWHLSDFESEAMWRLYSDSERGIAIRTTVDGLIKSFRCDADVYIGAVNYVDFSTEVIDEGTVFLPYLTKRKSFEYEREVRAITLNAVPDDRERLGASAEWVGTGIYYSVDLDLLVDEVLVAPQSEDWFVDLVQAVVKRYGLNTCVTRSTLADTPPWWMHKSQRLPGLLDELSSMLGEDFQLTTLSNAKVSHQGHQGLGVHYEDYASYVRLNFGTSTAETDTEP